MSERAHGTRATYEKGCRCLPCKAANATYWTTWRRTRRSGKLPLGAFISAVEAQRLIRLMLREQWSKMQLARELGQRGNLARLTQQDMIKVRTWLKVRRFYRLRVAVPALPPSDNSSHSS